MKWLLFSLIFLSAPAMAADEWKTSDKVLLTSALSLLVIDWGQTRSITQETVTSASLNGQAPVVTRNRPYYEQNPFLGENPTRKEIDRYFAFAAIGTVAIAHFLPTTYRKYFLGGVIVLEAGVVISNREIGLRVDF